MTSGAGNEAVDGTRFSITSPADIDARLVWRPVRDAGRGWTLYDAVGRWVR